MSPEEHQAIADRLVEGQQVAWEGVDEADCMAIAELLQARLTAAGRPEASIPADDVFLGLERAGATLRGAQAWGTLSDTVRGVNLTELCEQAAKATPAPVSAEILAELRSKLSIQ